MLLKVCGMKYGQNIIDLITIKPNWIGFIFYEKSPRFISHLSPSLINRLKKSTIHTVGVFVNASITYITDKVKLFGLDYVQLHGSERLEEAILLKEKEYKLIKVFSVLDTLPLEEIKRWEETADYLLFDRKTKKYGGSGLQFNWDILGDYQGDTPFLLSGGISLEDISNIHDLNHSKLVGVDVNSRFELRPSLKDIEKIKKLKEALC